MQVACGGRHALFLGRDGTVLGTGDNRSGQLGYGQEPRPAEGRPQGVWAVGPFEWLPAGAGSGAGGGAVRIELIGAGAEHSLFVGRVAAGEGAPLGGDTSVAVSTPVFGCGSNAMGQLGPAVGGRP